MCAHILFIDDDRAGREVALFNLRKAGYEVTPASDGQEGLSLFSAWKFELVVTDVKLPGISGIEVLKRIHKQAPEIPVLVITAFGNVETAVEAMKEGAYDFIGKPFHREQILLVVGKALERQRLAEEVRELKNACERMVILLDEWPPMPPEGLSLVDLEKKVIDRALKRNKGNMTQTAAYLRIPRHVLVYRLEKYGIRRETLQRNLRETAE
mgnify:FL=1